MTPKTRYIIEFDDEGEVVDVYKTNLQEFELNEEDSSLQILLEGLTKMFESGEL